MPFDQTLAQTALDLLSAEFSPNKEIKMKFTFTNAEVPAQTVVSVQRKIRVPEFHQWIPSTVDALYGHIKAAGAQPTGDPIGMYFGPVNEKDDGPVEISVPFTGMRLSMNSGLLITLFRTRSASSG